ncbi:MAG: Spy/CpxP family protein refolding chaperone [Verrucomicrobia bacterium]|nr:Spy/CpxP family protein refolding chaperone [Verrucomicrobiota bacterium]
MKFKYFLVPILAVIGCGWLQAQSADSTPLASPGNGPDEHWRHHHGWIWRELNLTEAQKVQIKSIRQDMKSKTHPALAAVLKAKLKLQQDIDANSEQALIAADASALATAESQFASVRAMELGQIKVLLTDEQKTTLQNLRQKREERMQEMINRLSQPTT